MHLSRGVVVDVRPCAEGGDIPLYLFEVQCCDFLGYKGLILSAERIGQISIAHCVARLPSLP